MGDSSFPFYLFSVDNLILNNLAYFSFYIYLHFGKTNRSEDRVLTCYFLHRSNCGSVFYILLIGISTDDLFSFSLV